MSKIDDLIRQYCPNGVEYKKLSKICIRQKGTPITATIMKKLNTPQAPIRIFAGGNTFADVNYGDIPDKDIITKTSIIVKSRGNIGFEFYTKPFSHKNEMWSYSSNNKDINLKFVYYYLTNKINDFQLKAKTGKLPQISTPDTDNYLIPIPPLPVQEEIVRVLDIFTALEAELEAELEARKRQYEYYRNKLLTFDENTTGGGIEWKILSEIILSLKTGLNPRKFFKLNTSDANNYYVTIKEIQNNTIIISDKTDKINDVALTLCQNRSKLEVGDILFSGTGTIGETAVIETPPTNWNIKEGVYAIKPNHKYIMSRFLMHLFHSENIRNAIFRKVVGGIVKSIPMNEIGKIIIPVPPLPEQERIVAILDKFDSLVNDISEGLPAELTARRQQYEYYRNKLLTFDEAA